MQKKNLALLGAVVTAGVVCLFFFTPTENVDAWLRKMNDEAVESVELDFSALASSKTLTQSQAIKDRGTVTGSNTECPAHCSWEFIKYTSSTLETTWVNMKGTDVENYSVCPDLKAHLSKELRDRWIEYTTKGQATSCLESGKLGSADRTTPARPAPANITADREVFSIFEYECSCSVGGRPPARRTVPIEPLAGPLRFPTTCFDSSAIQRKDYMIVDEWGAGVGRDRVRAGVDAGPTKNFLFDAGASTYGDGLGGASQSWFFETYRRRCVDFDLYAGWEPTPANHQAFWKAIPPPIRPIYHYYNTFCSADLENTMNPLNMIDAQTTVEDFVAFKLDIDTPSVELPIVQQMLDNPHITAKIDEFFFEHHVLFQPMAHIWQEQNCKGTYKESIDMFLKLRQMGVRAHSWV